MKKAVIVCLALLLTAGPPAWGRKAAAPALTISRGARVGVVSLLDPDITQYHTSGKIQESFLKTYQVQWPLDALFMDAVKQRLAQMGLEAVAVTPSPGLERSRHDYFIDHAVLNGLSVACAQEFKQMAAETHVDAFIVLAPGVNDSDHAGSTRRKDLPEYLRGWGYITKAEQPGAKPTVFDMTQVLLVSATGGTALLRAREFGGAYTDDWSSYTPPADPKTVAAEDLDSLKPVVSGLLTRQSNRVFDQVEVVGAP
jgi:hypothetical protein